MTSSLPKRKISQHRKSKGLEHIRYECEMFESTASWLRGASSGTPITLRNAVLESFTVHLRALIDFFYPCAPRSDDIIASDYVLGWQAGAMPPELENARDRTNKEIAHLTYRRNDVGPAAKGWAIASLTGLMFAVIAQFAEVVPEANLPVPTLVPMAAVSSTGSSASNALLDARSVSPADHYVVNK
jgi:hypothetical protein